VKLRTPEKGLAGIKCPEMTRVTLTDDAYGAIASTLPRARHGDPCSAIGANGFIQVEAAVVDRMMAMRRPGESYRDVISGS
jgi:hypothetical protein